MAQLFDCSTDNIGQHLKNIFESGELTAEATTENFSVVQNEGERQVNRSLKFYNLDAIISVGYRVNSTRATQFRQWCTFVLRQFAIRGYVIDRKRMENGTFIGEDYFEHLLAEIREIRLSERRFYQKLTDIYATSIDYNRDAPTTQVVIQEGTEQDALRGAWAHCRRIDRWMEPTPQKGHMEADSVGERSRW